MCKFKSLRSPEWENIHDIHIAVCNLYRLLNLWKNNAIYNCVKTFYIISKNTRCRNVILVPNKIYDKKFCNTVESQL